MAKTRVRDASYHVLDHEPNVGEIFGERSALGISSGRALTRTDTKLNYHPIRAQCSPIGRKLEWLKADHSGAADSSFTRCQVRKTISALGRCGPGVLRVRVRAVKNGSITVFPCAPRTQRKEHGVGERFSAFKPGEGSFRRSVLQKRKRERERERARERRKDGTPFLFFGEHCRPVRLDSRRIKF